MEAMTFRRGSLTMDVSIADGEWVVTWRPLEPGPPADVLADYLRSPVSARSVSYHPAGLLTLLSPEEARLLLGHVAALCQQLDEHVGYVVHAICAAHASHDQEALLNLAKELYETVGAARTATDTGRLAVDISADTT